MKRECINGHPPQGGADYTRKEPHTRPRRIRHLLHLLTMKKYDDAAHDENGFTNLPILYLQTHLHLRPLPPAPPQKASNNVKSQTQGG